MPRLPAYTSGVYASRYEFYDVSIGVTSNTARVIDALDGIYEHFKVRPGRCDMNLHVFVRDQDVSDNSRFQLEAVVSGRRDCANLFIEKNVYSDEMRNGYRVMHATLGSDALSWLSHLELCVFHFAARNLKRFVQVHCGCVAEGGTGIILPGGSGAGKTALACYLSRAGWKYLSDELALIDPANLHAWPFPRNPLVPTTVPLAEGEKMFDRRLVISGQGAEKRFVRLGPEELHPMTSGVHVGYVILPRWDASAPTDLVPISGSEALAALFDDAAILNMGYGPERAAEAMDTAARLVQQARCYRLSWREGSEAVAVIGDLVRAEGFGVCDLGEGAHDAISC